MVRWSGRRALRGMPVALSLLTVTAPAQAVHRLGASTGAIGEPFSFLAAVQELADGRVVVTDARDRTVYLASFERGTVERLGRNGNGPNEYTFAAQLVRAAGDTLLLLDTPARRVLLITPAGTLAGTRPMEIGATAPVVGAPARPENARITSGPRFRDDDGGLYHDVRYFGPARSVDPESFVARIDPVTKTSKLVAPLRAWYPERSARWRAPFMYQDVWAAAPDGRIARVVPVDYHVEWYKDGTLVAQGDPIPHEPVPVTRDDRQAWYAARAARGPAGAGLSGAPQPASPSSEPRRVPPPPGVTDADFPRTKPPFSEDGVGQAALIAPDGTLWVMRTYVWGARTRFTDVFDAAGRLVRRLELPADRRVVGFGKGVLYVVRTDADDLQWLERYPMP